MKTEIITLNSQRNVTLTAYLQPIGGEFPNIIKRPAMLVLPGGGYTMCSDREADPVALAYLEAGYQAFVLRYSVGKHAIWPNPLNDLEDAIALIRANADKWNLYPDKLAVVGFSAGGHLAGCAATMAKNKPNAAILGYAAVEGETIQNYHPTAPDVISAVDYDTCPCFVFSTRTDNMVPVRNSVKMMAALTEHDISYESHIYSYGPHGFSVANSSCLMPGTIMTNRVPRWVPDSIEWLKEVLGDIGMGTMTQPAFQNRINGNHDQTLSVDCTVAYLMSKPAAASIVQPMMASSNESYEAYLGNEAEMDENEPRMNPDLLMYHMTLRDILGFGQVSSEAIDQIDQALRQIPNT